MDTLLQDLRYAVKGLLGTPGFAAVTILCLALGIGVNSAIFSISDTVFLRPLPFDDPERLVAVYSTQLSNGVDRSAVSYQDFRDIKEQARSFSALAAQAYRNMAVTEGVESDRFFGSTVTWNLFPLLGVNPILGRHFAEADDRPGAAPVVMLSHGLWQRRYGSDAAIVGRTLIVNGVPHIVIGVMPPKFQFPQVAELWTPLVPAEFAAARTSRAIVPYARLADGATFDTANRELADVAARIAAAYRDDEGWSARLATMRDDLMPSNVQVGTTAMFGAVSLLLVVACANVANMLLARTTARQREIAVRVALGAGRWRLVRQLLTESAVLGLLSAPLGLLIAYFGLAALVGAIPPGVIFPYYVEFTMSIRVVIYTTTVSLLTGIVFGLAPALHAVGSNLFAALKDGGRGASGSRRRNRMRSTLVVVEVALSLVLLVGASLFVRSFLNIQNADGGIDTNPLMTLRLFMSGDAYGTPEAMATRVDDIVRRVEALPGVTAAFASNYVPLASGVTSAGIVAEGQPTEPGREPRIGIVAATSHTLRTIGHSLRAGRDFTDVEGVTKSAVAIVNQALAKRLWPGAPDVVGRRFRLLTAPDEWLTVVGTVSDFQPILLRDKATAEPLAILPYSYGATRDTGLTIRVAGGAPASITAAARQAIGQSDPLLALFSLRTGAENRRIRYWSAGMLSSMFAIFGIVALFLAGIGIYGVLSYSVAQRTQEFGVRVALGATRTNVFRLVVGQGARLAAFGITVGIAGAFFVTRMVQSILYNVTPTDPVAFGGTALFLALVTVLAGCVPAGRATGVDPIVALRAD